MSVLSSAVVDLRSFAETNAGGLLVTILVGILVGCDGTELQRVMEARRLSSDLLVQFTKATDASNRAVMADTDDASVAFAREAEQSTQMVQRDADALQMILMRPGYSAESRLLEEFTGRFAEYRELDRTILGLAVENTNLKAQRLSFGPIQKEADAFRDSLESLSPPSAKDSWETRALVASAVSEVREIQVLQAPHIVEADDEAMTRIEKRMNTSEARARSALKMLETLLGPAAKAQLAAAKAALDRFIELNSQLIALSRRNSNVRSLALSLGKKRMLIASCEESLRALQDALAKREFTGTR